MKSAVFEVYQWRSWYWKKRAEIEAKIPRRDRAKIPKPQWYWRLKGKNGEIVAQGESYTRKADCLRAVKAIRRLAATAQVK